MQSWKIQMFHMKCQVLQMLPPFISFLHGFERKINHNVLVSMLDPTFKNICVVINYVEQENATRLVVFYMNNYSSCCQCSVVNHEDYIQLMSLHPKLHKWILKIFFTIGKNYVILHHLMSKKLNGFHHYSTNAHFKCALTQ